MTGSDQPPALSFQQVFVAGALSGLAARLVTFPADTLKARLQLAGAVATGAAQRPRSTLAAARAQLSAEGVWSFYAGFGPVAWGLVPANLAYFGGYEAGKALLPADWGLAGDMATGAVAQVLAGVVYTPLDIAKERMQVASMMPGSAYSYSSALAAFRSLVAGGQGVAGLFRGYWATNCVWLPWNCLYVGGYEAARNAAAARLGCASVEQLPAWAVAGCSAAAAGGAALVTHPADVVKTRLQVLTAQLGSGGLTGLAVARQLLQREGPRAFWAGAAARLANIAPGCALSWALYERLKAWMAADAA